MEVLLPLM